MMEYESALKAEIAKSQEVHEKFSKLRQTIIPENLQRPAPMN